MENACEVCGGSGQIGHFPGVSRFVICWEECPECLGTGLQGYDETTEKSTRRSSPRNSQKDNDDHRS